MQRNRRDWHALQEAGPYEFVTPIEILTKRTKADPILPAEQNFEDGQTIAVDEV